MKIERLDLTRFGCFTGVTLDLSRPGTHVVVGANEAGKTTGKAAIRQLLFGIPVRSPHAFRHEMRDLCLGALLRDDAGELLEIIRVKRLADTLRDRHGEVLDESVLARFRHDIDEAVYASLFAIGHDEIARGGEALLVSDGELGRALFSASRGTTDLTAVLRRLDERAAALFKSAASLPRLNAAIRDYKEGIATAKQLSRSATEVVQLDEQLRGAQQDYEGTVAERKRLAQRKTQLDRIRAARPQLATRQDCLVQKGDRERAGVLVDPAVRGAFEAALAKRREGEARCRSAEVAIERLDRKLGELPVDSPLVEQRDVIDQLQAESGGYRQNLTDLPGLVARAGSLERDVTAIRRSLPEGCPLEADLQPGLTLAQLARIRELAAARPTLDVQLGHAADQVAATTSSLDARRRELAALDSPADVGVLVPVTSRVRRAGDLEATRTETARRLQTVDATLANETRALGLDGVDPRGLDAVAVPAVETIRELRGQLDQLAGVVARLEEQLAGLDSQREGTQNELAELLTAEHPPSEGDLLAARSRRDEGWRLVRGAWLDGSADREAVATWSAGAPLETAYEAAVGQADEVADRLREEAQAVERRVTLERKLAEIAGDFATRREELAGTRAERAEAEASWVELWQQVHVAAGSPEVMEKWRDTFRDCAQQAVEARRLAAEIGGLDDTIARHQADMVAALSSAGEPPPEGMSLLGLLDLADRVATAAAEAQQQRVRLTKSCDEEAELLGRQVLARDKAMAAMGRWEADWAEAVGALGLDPAASPSEAMAVLVALDGLTATGRGLADVRRRIAGIEARNTSFATGVAAALASLDGHADLAGANPDVATTSLARRLAVALEVATERRTTAGERESHEQDRTDAGLEVAEAAESIRQLVVAAGAADEAQLAEAIARSEEHAELVERIAQLEEDLRRSTGLAMSEIENEAAELAGVEIEPEIAELLREIEGLDKALEIQANTVGKLTNARSLIDSSGAAADALSGAQQSLAAVASYGEEYVQVLLAKRLLEEQVNRYRDEHQGPLLARGRELFRSLTLDRYLGLDTDTDDKGNPYLLARTAAGQLLDISALSTGTRDQLYLALRLAALEHFIDRRGPLPLVLDDLFVHFDDERTAAGLAVLDEVAGRAQVLLFTHHEQVARQAAGVIDADRLTVHQLG